MNCYTQGNKKIIIFIVLFILFFKTSLHSADGVMSGEKNIKVIQTKWFDIIYSEDSFESAVHLSKNADTIYSEVCDFLETEQWKRFPVVITSSQDLYNAYYSPASYDTIVMYDTAIVQEVAVSSDDFLLTFKHELTHAVSYNMKNKFWRTVSSIFGDVINPAYLFITRSRTEGISITSESMAGEGRLNNPYSLQMVRQAKLENMFPSYADVYGSRDIYPYDTNYYFGAAFENWVQKRFGMKAYSKFLYKCVNFQTIHQSVAFKSVFGISVKDAWQQFYNSIEVPAKNYNLLEDSAYIDYFSGNDNRSIENKTNSLYNSLSISEKGFGYVNEQNDSFYFSKLEGEYYTRPKKLFTAKNQTRTVLSQDGNYVAVSIITNKYAVPKSEIHIYDIKNKRWYRIKETGIRDGTIITFNGEHYLSAIKTKSRNAKLVVYKLNKYNGKLNNEQLIIEKEFETGDIAFLPIDAGDGNVTYILKKNNLWCVQNYSFINNNFVTYEMPFEDIVLHDISLATNKIGEKSFLFSWGAKQTMPRLGKLVINNNGARVVLQNNDISGGVYNPVLLKTGAIVFSGRFFRDWRLTIANIKKIETTQIAINYFVDNDNKKITSSFEQDENIDVIQQKYNPFKYYKNGILLPISISSTYTYDDATDDFVSRILPLGITYASNNPWSSKIFVASAGYSFLSNSGAIETIFTSGTATSLFNYTIKNQIEFDRNIFKQTSHSISLSSAIPIGKISSFIFANYTQLFVGHQSNSFDDNILKKIYFASLERNNFENEFIAVNNFSITYTNIHKTGARVYEAGGISLSAFYDVTLRTKLNQEITLDNLHQNLSAKIKIQSPFLLPYKCVYDFTYNFPFAISVQIFASKNTFLKTNAEVVLFAGEVQKAIPFIYINRYSLKLAYDGSFLYNSKNSWDFLQTPELTKQLVNGKMKYIDSLSLLATLTLTPNFGAAATPLLSSTIIAGAKYNIRYQAKNKFTFVLGWKLGY